MFEEFRSLPFEMFRSVFYNLYGVRVSVVRDDLQFQHTRQDAAHTFEVPMPNSPLLLNYLCFGTLF